MTTVWAATAAQEDGGAFHVFQEERDDEDAEQRRIENGSNDVEGLDEVFRKTHEKRAKPMAKRPQTAVNVLATRTLRASSCAARGGTCARGQVVEVVARALSSPALEESAEANITARSRPITPWGSWVRMKLMKT